eukprot:Opistho-2@62237
MLLAVIGHLTAHDLPNILNDHIIRCDALRREQAPIVDERAPKPQVLTPRRECVELHQLTSFQVVRNRIHITPVICAVAPPRRQRRLATHASRHAILVALCAGSAQGLLESISLPVAPGCRLALLRNDQRRADTRIKVAHRTSKQLGYKIGGVFTTLCPLKVTRLTIRHSATTATCTGRRSLSGVDSHGEFRRHLRPGTFRPQCIRTPRDEGTLKLTHSATDSQTLGVGVFTLDGKRTRGDRIKTRSPPAAPRGQGDRILHRQFRRRILQQCTVFRIKTAEERRQAAANPRRRARDKKIT